MRYYVIALTLLSILTGCVTTTQTEKSKPKPFVEPIEWSNATPFEEFKNGLFYIDSPETATYLKDWGKFYISGVSPFQQMSLEGIDVLLFNPFQTCQYTIKGRLEDTVIRYYFLKTSSNEIDKKILVYENAFGVKRNVIRVESTAKGVYFANTSIFQDSPSQSARFLTTKGVVVEGSNINLILKRADAEIAGKDAIVRIYFSLDMDSLPIKYTYDSDDR